MTTRQRNGLLLLGALLLSATGLVLFAPPRRELAALDALPSGAFLVATLDVARLRSSPLATELAGLEDVKGMTEACGFDPLFRASSLAVAVPEKPDGVFGLAIATRDLSEDDLVRCAQRVMSQRSALARVVKRGMWTEIEQEGALHASQARIAYRPGYPLLVSRSDYLAVMQAALAGDHAHAADEPDHAALRTGITALVPDAVLLVTGVLPKSVRDKVRDQTIADQATMNAVLSVKTFGVAVAPRGPDVRVVAELVCETAPACQTVRDVIARKVHGLPWHLEVTVHDTEVHLELTAPARGLVDVAVELLAGAPGP